MLNFHITENCFVQDSGGTAKLTPVFTQSVSSPDNFKCSLCLLFLLFFVLVVLQKSINA